MDQASHKILVLFATQTGNAQDVAERIGREAARRHFTPSVLSINNYSPAQLCREGTVILVASTTGQGDPPDSIKTFWKFLLRKSLGERWLERLHYAVFGLGDSGYQHYNVIAKKLDKRLLDLGGKPLVQRGLGDDQHPSGYEAALDPWLVALWSAMRNRFPLPYGLTDPRPEDVGALDPPKFWVKYHQLRAGSQLADLPGDTNAGNVVLRGVARDFSLRADKHNSPTCPNVFKHLKIIGILDKWAEYQKAYRMVSNAGGLFPMSNHPEPLGRGLGHPIFAKMVENERLTAEDHFQDVRHIEFDLGNTGLQYEPGDILSIMPRQDGKLIDAFLSRCNLQADAYVSIEAAGDNSLCNPSERLQNKKFAVRLRSLVDAVMDVSSASPSRYFFEVMSHFATAEHEKERLKYFVTPEGRDDLYQYNQRERRTVLEVLEDFPSVQMPFEWLLQITPVMKPRAFSISSSIRAHPNRAKITVAVVEWVTPFKRKRYGLCSKWLSQLQPAKGEVFVPCWVSQGALKLPPPDAPLILVGPGTGCAPFKAFLEERSQQSNVQSVAPSLFFFGCRNRCKDYLYEHFWLSCTKSGSVLSKDRGGGLSVAFSRDQPGKVYVQDKIVEESATVWRILQSGGTIVVAGSAKMPTDVMKAFESAIARETGWSSALAGRWLKALEKCGRYLVEAWG